MTVDYQIRLLSATGEHIDFITEFTALDWAIAENEVGEANLILPQGKFSYNDWRPDQQFEIWRKSNGTKQLIGDTGWFVRKWRYFQEDGESYAEITANDAKDLLKRRIVAYPADSDYTELTDPPDDMMKQVVRQNMGGSATSTDRNFGSDHFTVQANSSNCTSVTKAFSRQNVFSLLQDLANNAKGNDEYLVFDVVRTDHTQYEFRTYFGARGIDRSSDSDNRKIISVEAGNLANPSLSRDHVTEKNYIYVGGQGIEANRAIGTASDSDAIALSYWGRCEYFTPNNMTDDQTTLDNTAKEELYQHKAKTIMTGELIDCDGTRFGIDYKYGDIVPVSYLGVTVDCHIDAMAGNVRRNNFSGQYETLTTRLRGEL